MKRRFYLDSNVFISFVREEIDKAFNLRFQESMDFFKLCNQGKLEVVLSKLFFAEVQKITALKKELVLEEFKRLEIEIKETGTMPDEKLAFEIVKECGIHYSDALHVAFAIGNKADFIITWNRKDFEKTGKLVKCLTPSEISSNL